MFPAPVHPDSRQQFLLPDPSGDPQMTFQPKDLHVAPLLAAIATQAPLADTGRSVAAEVIAGLKANNVMRLTA